MTVYLHSYLGVVTLSFKIAHAFTVIVEGIWYALTFTVNFYK
jgi:hypothetical protein